MMKLTAFRPTTNHVWNTGIGLDDFDALLKKVFAPDAFSTQKCWIPPVDVHEHENEFSIRAETPGVDPKTLDLSIKDGVLTLTGEKRRESEEKNGKYHRTERRYGRFERSFLLPDTVDTESIKADFRDGILQVTLPKREATKPRRIEVTN